MLDDAIEYLKQLQLQVQVIEHRVAVIYSDIFDLLWLHTYVI